MEMETNVIGKDIHEVRAFECIHGRHIEEKTQLDMVT